MQWTFRIAFLVIFAAMAYVALLPEFKFETWITVQSLKAFNIPEALASAIHLQIDKIAHFIGAFALVLLCRRSIKSANFMSSGTLLLALLALAVTAEVAQSLIGRGFSLGDIVAGMLGGIFAVVTIKLTAHLKANKAPPIPLLTTTARHDGEPIR